MRKAISQFVYFILPSILYIGIGIYKMIDVIKRIPKGKTS